LREALLLHVIEGFTPEQIGMILDTKQGMLAGLARQAMEVMEASVSGSVMVIEDKAINAPDIAYIVRSMDHRLTRIARTHARAIAIAQRGKTF